MGAAVTWMRWMALVIVLALTMTFGCRHHEPERQPVFETGPIHWGQPVNGLQAGLAIQQQVSGPRSLIWEPVYIEFCLRNVSDQRIRIIEPFVPCERIDRPRGRPMVEAQCTTPDGRIYRIGLLPPIHPGSTVRSIAPGEVYSVKGQFDGTLMLAPGYWGLSAPLEAECVLSFHNTSPEAPLSIGGGKSVTVRNLWTGDAESAPMRVRFEDVGNDAQAGEP